MTPPPVRAYLAGPMTGYELTNWPAFFRAAQILREHGWEIENPAEYDIIKGFDPTRSPDEQGHPRTGLLREDFAIIATKCKAIILLPGWRESEGARAEFLVSILSGHKAYEFVGDSSLERGFELVLVTSKPEVVLR